jgi:ATP-dependent Clp protease protease subunit
MAKLPAGLPTLTPDIRLHGTIDDKTLDSFQEQLEAARQKDGPILLELTTSGGEADIGRRIARDIVLEREHGGRDMVILGKSAVYSAGITILGAFLPERRFVTADTLLLIHERRMEKTMELKGAMRANRAIVNDVLAEIDSAMAVERDDFAQLVAGTGLTVDALLERVLARDWYLFAKEALQLRLVAALV